MGLIYMADSIELMRKGLKDQTRRLAKLDDEIETGLIGRFRVRIDDMDPDALIVGPVISAFYRNGREQMRVCKDYAIRPGRTAKGIGRMHVINMRLQRLVDISEADVKAEGAYFDNTFATGTGKKGEWVMKFRGKEFRGQDARQVFLTGFKRLHPKIEVEKQLVYAIQFRCTWD